MEVSSRGLRGDRIICVMMMLTDMAFVGSPWGAGTLAGPTGARQPSELELEVARRQGAAFWNIVSKVKF